MGLKYLCNRDVTNALANRSIKKYKKHYSKFQRQWNYTQNKVKPHLVNQENPEQVLEKIMKYIIK